jgi:hypothetical protein
VDERAPSSAGSRSPYTPAHTPARCIWSSLRLPTPVHAPTAWGARTHLESGPVSLGRDVHMGSAPPAPGWRRSSAHGLLTNSPILGAPPFADAHGADASVFRPGSFVPRSPCTRVLFWVDHERVRAVPCAREDVGAKERKDVLGDLRRRRGREVVLSIMSPPYDHAN